MSLTTENRTAICNGNCPGHFGAFLKVSLYCMRTAAGRDFCFGVSVAEWLACERHSGLHAVSKRFGIELGIPAF
jgi:hypothetical protein